VNLADAHGTLSRSIQGKLLQVADGVILHVPHTAVKNVRKLRYEVESLAEAGARLVVILVRDVDNVQGMEAFYSDSFIPQLNLTRNWGGEGK
jgi:hypothetical protein